MAKQTSERPARHKQPQSLKIKDVDASSPLLTFSSICDEKQGTQIPSASLRTAKMEDKLRGIA